MDKSLFLFAAEGEIHPLIVCLIGVVVVFVGLACIIGLVSLMTLICNKLLDGGAKKKKQKAEVQSPMAASAPCVVENRGEIVAAVCAAIAEEEGTDISAIRVISFKKVS